MNRAVNNRHPSHTQIDPVAVKKKISISSDRVIRTDEYFVFFFSFVSFTTIAHLNITVFKYRKNYIRMNYVYVRVLNLEIAIRAFTRTGTKTSC